MFKLILVLALAGSAFANYGNYEQKMPVPQRAPVVPTPMAPTMYGSYGQGPVVPPMADEPVNMNPCTEEAMRAMEIQLFDNPMDEATYIICTDVGVFVTMPCSPGTVFNTVLRHCIPVGWEAPVCPVGTCMNQADCFLNEFGQPKCNCRVGFTGERCEVNINECELEGDANCQRDGGVCVDQVNAFYCSYDNGASIGFSRQQYIPTPCTIQELSFGKQFYELPSLNKNVYVQCTNENEFVVSRCADMLFWHQELRTCSIDIPMKKTGVCQQYPCKNDGECLDLGSNNFECKCKEGFTGALCEEPIDFCLNMPCGSGRCVSHTGGFNCICQNDIVAQSCDIELRNPCVPELTYAACDKHQDHYFSCAFDKAFLKSCAPGLIWRQEVLTCVLVEQVQAPMMFPQQTMPSREPSMAQASSYGQYRTSMPEVPSFEAPVPVQTTTPQSYGYKMPEVPRFEAPLPVQTTTPFVPVTTTQSYGYRTQEVPRFEAPVQTTPFVPVTAPSSYGMPSYPQQGPQQGFRSFMPEAPRMQVPQMQRPQMQAPRMQMPQFPTQQRMQAPRRF
jgi:hypothetical protein